MMYSKRKWWFIACSQVTALGLLGAVAMFESRNHGEVSIFTKYAMTVWLLYMVLHVLSLFLEPISKED